MYRIYKEHLNRLPKIRIRKIELTNFKGVESGTIEFNCAKEFVPSNTQSDILGLYGQNGSGKSSLVEALVVLKRLIGGYPLGEDCIEYVDVASDFCKIKTEFEFQYDAETVGIVDYDVIIDHKKKSESNFQNMINMAYPFGISGQDTSEDRGQLCISREVIKTNIYDDGNIGRLHTIVDTGDEQLFCGDSLEKFYFSPDSKEELKYIKRRTKEDSMSFVFCNALSETLNINNSSSSTCSKYYEILSELVFYTNRFLYIISTRSSGLVQLRAGIPIYVPILQEPILLNERSTIPERLFKYVKGAVEGINTVLCTVIPDLQLEIEGNPTKNEEGEPDMLVSLMARRGDRVFPFRYESDGIIKLVSVLADFIFAFNDPSVTLVIDEFDSGVYEYLLGELLQIFEKSGKGQLIFTSHNLRPLEVLDKKFIRFTTADPKNRYYKLKNVAASNNLRDLYLREIQIGTQGVDVYKGSKTFKISKALKNANLGVKSDGE